MNGGGDTTALASSHPTSYDGIISAILETALDKEAHVSESVCNSLCFLGKRHPDNVLQKLLTYLRVENRKLTHVNQRTRLLKLTARILRESVKSTDVNIRKEFIVYCIREICNKENLQDIQQLSSDVIVAIGVVYHNEVMDVLFEMFQPETLPNFYIVKTLADLSSENPFGLVPYIKALLGTMLTMLSTAKSDNSKWIFAYCLARFSEAIEEYLANIDKAPDASVRVEYFSTELGSAFEVLFVHWYQTRDSRLREQIIEALGLMSPLLDSPKLAEFIPKLVTAYLMLYSRGRQALSLTMVAKEFRIHIATQSFNLILCSAIKCSSNSLQPQLADIMSTLFSQVCTPVDYTQPTSIRNHNELLRCFATLTKVYSDLVVPFVLQRLDNSSLAVKCGALNILKHLINSCTEQLKTKLTPILFSIRLVLGDESNKVKKLVVQVIVALAHHRFLIVDGGQVLIKFLIRQCAIDSGTETSGSPSRRSSLADPDDLGNESLKTMCENVMHLLVTTVEGIEAVLWPFLFELVLLPEYSRALPVIYRSLAVIGEKLKSDITQENSAFEIDYTKTSELLKPHSLLARLFVTIGSRLSAAVDPGVRLMSVISPVINKSLTPLWDTMLSQYTEAERKFDLNSWQSNFAALANQSLIEIDSDEFCLNFGKSLLSQVSVYEGDADGKYFSLLLIGNVTRRLASKPFTLEVIDSLFPKTEHSNEQERRGLAYVMGQSSAAHLDMVLVKLENFAEAKRGSSFLNIVMDSVGSRSPTNDQDKVRATAMLSYGQACTYAPPELLVTRIETPIIRTLAAYYQASKDPIIRRSFLESVRVIADSMHPESLKMSFTLRSRNELLHEMISVLKEPQSLSEQNILLAVDAISSLVKLNPKLGSSEKSNVIEVVSRVTLAAYNNEKLLKALENLALQILIRDDYASATLELVINSISPWLKSRLEYERENAVEVVQLILITYQGGLAHARYQSFEPFARLTSLLVPRATDPVLKIRYKALACIKLACLISDTLRSRSSDKDACIAELDQLADSCDSRPPIEISEALAKCISKRLVTENVPLITFASLVMGGILDTETGASVGTVVLIRKLAELRKEDIAKDIPVLLLGLCEKLASISCNETRLVLYSTLRSLASSHLKAVLDGLLKLPLPLDETSQGVWQNLAADNALCKHIIHHLQSLVVEARVVFLVREPGSKGPKKPQSSLCTPEALAPICAFREVFKVSLMDQTGQSVYGPLLAALLAWMARFLGSAFSDDRADSDCGQINAVGQLVMPDELKPSNCIVETLKVFFAFSKQIELQNELNLNHWLAIDSYNNFVAGLSSMAKVLCSSYPSLMASAVTSLSKTAAQSGSEGAINERLVCVIFFAEILSQRLVDDSALTELLTNSLLNALDDPSPLVRQMAIRGLAYVGLNNKELLPKFASVIVSALLSALDDREHEELTAEALQGFCNIIDHLSLSDISHNLFNIALIVRNFFDKSLPSLRAKAFIVFSKLVVFAEKSGDVSITETFKANVIPLIIYLNDDSNEVVRSCKIALRSLSSIMTGSLRELCQKALVTETNLHYGEFVNSFSKLLVQEMGDNCDDYVLTGISYLKSERTVIQCNAIVLIGFLLANQEVLVAKGNKSAREKAIGALLGLLNCSSSAVVRVKTVEALCLL